MASCKTIEARADRDYAQLQKAWADLERARGRLFSVKRASRQIRSQPTVKAGTKARAAVAQADAKVKAISARVTRSFNAVKKCHRRKVP